MATFYITEFTGGLMFGTPAPKDPPVARQTIAIAGASAPSQAFNEATKMIKIHTDAICSIRIGAANQTPTAVTTDDRMAANQSEYRIVEPGAKLAVISNV